MKNTQRTHKETLSITPKGKHIHSLYYATAEYYTILKPTQHVKKQRHHFVDKCPHCKSYGFSSTLVRMWESDHKERWVLKNWCFWIVVMEKTLESPLDCKEIKPVNPKGNQPSMFTGRIDTEADFGHLMQKANSLEKILMLRKIEGIRRSGQQRRNGEKASLTQWTWIWANSRR